ncbi:GIP [Symbiodinium sp. CCMP2456]|nr:GIP [Symbiodinium sp. CCMP2456]
MGAILGRLSEMEDENLRLQAELDREKAKVGIHKFLPLYLLPRQYPKAMIREIVTYQTNELIPGVGAPQQPAPVPGTKASLQSSEATVIEALAQSMRQLQEIQLKNLQKDGIGDDVPEVVKTGLAALPVLGPPDGDQSGLLFQDWLVQITTAMQDLSSGSGSWWELVKNAVTKAYETWLAASPLERLGIEPHAAADLITGKWVRVNARSCAMVVQAIPEAIKHDLIARRATQSMPLMLFPLYTLYQPGGAGERSVILQRLQGGDRPQGDQECLQMLRAWPRWLQRCQDMKMSIPDGTVLAKGLSTTTAATISSSPDAMFRTQLVRATLKIDQQPSLDDVVKYQKHLQAEVEMILSSSLKVTSAPSIKAVNVPTTELANVLPVEVRSPTSAKGHAEPEGCGQGSKYGYSVVDLAYDQCGFVEGSQGNYDEWQSGSAVLVNLAGGETVELKMNAAGTLLVPMSGPSETTSATAPIVPLGSLVEMLGYRLEWAGSRCKLFGRDGEVINLRVRNGCPEITEQQALSLISKIEDRKPESLKSLTEITKAKVREAALALNKTWFDHLLTYCESGLSSEALLAIDRAPFFEGVHRPALQGLAEAVPISNGWDALKGLRFVVLELDLERGKTHDVNNPLVWRALEWGARHGRIASLVGGPPQNSFMLRRHMTPGPEVLRSAEFPYGGWSGLSAAEVDYVNKHTGLFAKMLYLHALSTAGRTKFPPDPADVREVGFLLEQPRDPRGYLRFDDPLFQDCVSFWRTPMWQECAEEAGMSSYSFDMSSIGKALPRHTTIGTNLPLRHLDGLRGRIQLDAVPPEKAPPSVWSREFSEVVAIAVRTQRLSPRMLKMSTEQWREHVRRGHLPYRSDCLTCVSAGATGRRHARVEHPSCFVMSADVSGPLKVPGLDADARGAFPRPHKYLFVAKVRIPKALVDDGRGACVEYDPGELEADGPIAEGAFDFSEDVSPGAAGEEGVREEEPVAADEDDDDGVQTKRKDPQRHEDDSDLTGPDLVNLVFAAATPDNKSATVLECIQDVVLYCNSLNIPVLRFHCDRGMEFYAKATRQWLKYHGIRFTTSEGGVYGCGIPESNHTGDGDEAGSAIRRTGVGKYLGLSDTVRRGHVIYVTEGEAEKFIHTVHVRTEFTEPEIPDVFEADLPGSDYRGDEELKAKASALMNSWSQEEAESLCVQIALMLGSHERVFGVFRHGGAVGLTRATFDRSWIVEFFVKTFVMKCPDAEFTSLYVSVNAQKDLHTDSNNLSGKSNYLYPIVMPRRGGDLWIEISDGDIVRGKVTEMLDSRGVPHYGCVSPLEQGRITVFDPRRRHAVLPWKGLRIAAYTTGVLRNLSGADREVLARLGFPVPPEGDDPAPEVSLRMVSVQAQKEDNYIKELEEEICAIPKSMTSNTDGGTNDRTLDQQSSDEEEKINDGFLMRSTDEEVEHWDMYLPLREGDPEAVPKVKIASSSASIQMSKMEVTYTSNVEHLLDGLSSPLAIVHTVDPKEAQDSFSKWIPSVEKEMR